MSFCDAILGRHFGMPFWDAILGHLVFFQPHPHRRTCLSSSSSAKCHSKMAQDLLQMSKQGINCS
jgi:hypothetical protein